MMRLLARGVAAGLAWFSGLEAHAAASPTWLKVRADEFTVIAALPEKAAVAWANDFAQFVAALRDYIPVDPRRLPRLTLVVFARESDFAEFAPRRADGGTIAAAGFFARRDSWAVAGLPGEDPGAETRAILFHEGTHWFLSAFEYPNPAWLEEGLAEVFSTFAPEAKSVSWGRAIDGHVATLRQAPRMPLEDLLFLPQENLHGDGDAADERTAVAYAQSWAFVHYLIFGQRTVPRSALTDYVRGLRAEHPDEAFRKAFAGTYAEVEKKLREYLDGGDYMIAKRPRRTLPPLGAVPAGVAEVEEALARLRIGGGRPGEARTNIARLIAADPASPRGHELEGEAALEREDRAAAQAAFAQAVELGSADFRPYLELAREEHRAARESLSLALGLPADRARVIASRYERAINLNPRCREAYQGLAEMMEWVPPGNAEDGKFLELGATLYPRDAAVRIGRAVLAKRSGDEATARAILGEVLGRGATEPPEAAAWARRLEGAWTSADVSARVDLLVKGKRFAEAHALLDAEIAAGVSIPTRQKLESRRKLVRSAELWEEAQLATQEKRWHDALGKLNALLEISTSPVVNAQARRQIEQIERRIKTP